MLFPSATVVAALVLSLAGASPLEARTAARGARDVRSAARRRSVVAGLWAPKKASKPRPARDDNDAREEELLKPQRARGGGDSAAEASGGRSRWTRGQEEGDDEAEEGDEDDDEDKPKVIKRRKRVVEEEEDEAPEPIASQPSIIPRLINFGIGTAVMQAQLRLRPGDAAGRQGRPARLSARARELSAGDAAERLVSDDRHRRLLREGIRRRDPQRRRAGMFIGYPSTRAAGASTRASRSRPANGSIVMPAVGYGRIGADLRADDADRAVRLHGRRPTDPCFARRQGVVPVGRPAHPRRAVADVRAVAVGRLPARASASRAGMDQITAEAAGVDEGLPRRARRVDADRRLVRRCRRPIPFRRYGFAFDAADGQRRSRTAPPTDMYYGVIAGIAVLTK